jgi:dGTPase
MTAHQSDRARTWAETMGGTQVAESDRSSGTTVVRRAHSAFDTPVGPVPALSRLAREELEDASMAPGATRAAGAGDRAVAELPDAERTCFERDRDRILHSSAFRRLAGKTQVFVFPDDHQRTRLTHALEVAQVASAIARSIGVNVALTEAIALGHDCGHGPGGHASEDAFSPYVAGGYDHAVWGADQVLAPLNLCTQTLDGIRNHSWSRPAPATPEGEVVAWADRIAYVCHDFEDAEQAGIVRADQLPALVLDRCGDRRSRQLHAFIDGVVDAVRTTGTISMVEPLAEALAEFRRFNYDHIYMRAESIAQSESVIVVLRALVELHGERPELVPRDDPAAAPAAGSDSALTDAVTYVGGMTDRYAFDRAVELLDWDERRLPIGIR